MSELPSRYKIAFIIDSYSRGGVALAMQTLLHFLTKENYDITLFVKNADGKLLQIPEGVVLKPWGEKYGFSLKNRFLQIINFRNYGKKTVYQAREREMLPGEYDCAIAYQMIHNDVSVLALEKICAKRKILWLHGKKNFRKRDIPFYDKLYSKADNIVCVSLGTEERFKRLMPRSSEKTVTIHNLYDIDAILSNAELPPAGMEKKHGETTIVSVGRLSKEKGFDRVPPIAQKLIGAGYKIQWYIIGDGDLRADIEADINKMQLSGVVYLLGHRENPYPYIANCDIYVQPSYTEGFCTSTMEAKILCKPVVATDVPGMREQFVSGENGLIVESSVDGIHNGICGLLDSPETMNRITENLQNSPFSNELVLRKTMEIIEGRDLES